MYEVKLDDITFPLAPARIEIDEKNAIRTLKTINGREINIPYSYGATAISFAVVLPQEEHPFAEYGEEGFRSAPYYIDKVEAIHMGMRVVIVL